MGLESPVVMWSKDVIPSKVLPVGFYKADLYKRYEEQYADLKKGSLEATNPVGRARISTQSLINRCHTLVFVILGIGTTKRCALRVVGQIFSDYCVPANSEIASLMRKSYCSAQLEVLKAQLVQHLKEASAEFAHYKLLHTQSLGPRILIPIIKWCTMPRMLFCFVLWSSPDSFTLLLDLSLTLLATQVASLIRTMFSVCRRETRRTVGPTILSYLLVPHSRYTSQGDLAAGK